MLIKLSIYCPQKFKFVKYTLWGRSTEENFFSTLLNDCSQKSDSKNIKTMPRVLNTAKIISLERVNGLCEFLLDKIIIIIIIILSRDAIIWRERDKNVCQL